MNRFLNWLDRFPLWLVHAMVGVMFLLQVVAFIGRGDMEGVQFAFIAMLLYALAESLRCDTKRDADAAVEGWRKSNDLLQRVLDEREGKALRVDGDLRGTWRSHRSGIVREDGSVEYANQVYDPRDR